MECEALQMHKKGLNTCRDVSMNRDVENRNPNVCKDAEGNPLPKGTGIIARGAAVPYWKHEIEAHKKEIKCLNKTLKELKKTKKASCKKTIERRINAVKGFIKQYENLIRKNS